jgi:hypothetical protein
MKTLEFSAVRSLCKTLVVAFALVTFAVSAQAPLDVRVALVIGNAAYAGSAALANPANDSRAMADTLKQLGFTVVELRDSGKNEMNEAIVKVRDALKGKQGVGMLYYAGHGLQVDWRNYMVPVDARMSSAADVSAQAIDVSTVLDAFKGAGNRMNILVLDACRDNPFAATSSGKGLAPVDAPPGTLLAYATAPGNVADDGDAKGGNGLYTQYLLEELKKPSARIEDVFKRVRLNVRKQSQGRQIPWESTSLEDDFYFNRGVVVQTVKPDARGKELAFLAEKTEWEKIRDSKNVDDFYAFLQKYPSGFVSEQAQFRVEQLQKAQTVAVANRDGIVPLPATTVRYPVGTVIAYKMKDVFGKSLPTSNLEVTDIRDGTFVFNRGEEVWDEMGNLLKGGYGVYSPAKAYFPSEVMVGKKWRTAYDLFHVDGRKYSLYWDFHVKALETVDVPAGAFKAFRVEGVSFVSNGTSQVETFWIDPERMLVVKDIYTQRYNGRVAQSYVKELLSFKRG